MRDARQGTRRLYRVDAEGLRALRAYLERYWDVTLAPFKEHVEGEDEDEP